ncbi:helix-turn-helix domain-containing protein [Alphaproteobacteria bacterium GH1-50]|uniref:Helix-turn-helix domain-containing protein n=1 Tax=Kangsaoukella pontilimi TaxID=2691042 RepID=A0A7C9MDT9_9RHOB|nr:helix-turn-helix domain-containing protein [Kangsaoukella pontilimi]MXQ07892.1 helix-turn-helix domain-containing protein [Kangsaoukella pontilimi]
MGLIERLEEKIDAVLDRLEALEMAEAMAVSVSPADAVRWLTPEQAAEHLAVGVRTLEHWRTKGGGPPFARQGRTVRYEVKRLDEWMNARGSK